MSAQRRTTVLLALAAIAPALVCLAWTIALSPCTPEPEEWRTSRGDEGLQFTWFYLAHGPDPARLALFRLFYLGLLQFPGSDFGRFGFVTWALALSTVVSIAALVRRATEGPSGRILAGLGTALLSAWAFSPGFGADWLVAARLGLFVPPLFFVLGVLLLCRGPGARRLVLAGLLALTAPFFDRSGVLVWALLIPLVWVQAPPERRTTRVAFWVIFGNVVTAASFGSLWTEDVEQRAGIARHALDAPWPALRAVLGALGDTVPRVVPAFAAERVVVGVLLLAAFLLLTARAWRLRGDDRVWRRALPWALLAAFGIGNAIVLCDAYFAQELDAEAWRELGWGGVLLPVGILGLATASLGRPPRPALVLGAVALGLLLLRDWHGGWEHLKVQRARLHQAGAQLVFAGAMAGRLPPGEGPAILDPEVTQVLRDIGRLRGVDQVVTPALSQLRVEEAPEGVGEIAGTAGDTVQGVVHATTFRFAPDLVLVTLRRASGGEADEEELILRIAAPACAVGGKHFFWSAEIDDEVRPGDELRAFGFHLRGRRTVPLAGRIRRTETGFVREAP